MSADHWVTMLSDLFARHPAWVQAARHLQDGAESRVFFSHRPGQPWHLVRQGGVSHLRSGPATDPDFAFRFTPAAIESLAATEGNVGAFAVRVFELILEADPRVRIGFRIIAPVARLWRRGYLRLFLAAGPRVMALAGRHGIHSVGELTRLIRDLRRVAPAPWEDVNV
jgi:hypothetical protein